MSTHIGRNGLRLDTMYQNPSYGKTVTRVRLVNYIRSIRGILPTVDPILAMDYAELSVLYTNVLMCQDEFITFPTNSKVTTTVINLSPSEERAAYAYNNSKTGYLNVPSICLGIK